MDENKMFYTAREVAKMFGVSQGTVVEWCKTGKLRAWRPGREWRIPKVEIEKLLYGEEYVRNRYNQRD